MLSSPSLTESTRESLLLSGRDSVDSTVLLRSTSTLSGRHALVCRDLDPSPSHRTSYCLYIDEIMLIRNQGVQTALDSLVKYRCARGWEMQQPVISGMLLGVSWHREFPDIPFKVKDRLLYLSFLKTKKEAQCLMDPLYFGGNIYPHLGLFL